MSVESKELNKSAALQPVSYGEQIVRAKAEVAARGITKLAVSLGSKDSQHLAPVLGDEVEIVETEADVLDVVGENQSEIAGIIPVSTKNGGEIILHPESDTTATQAIEDDSRGLGVIATVTGTKTKENTDPTTLAIVVPVQDEYAITAKDGNGPRYGFGG